MRHRGALIALLSAAFVLAFGGPALAASASMTLAPMHGPADQAMAATYVIAQSAEEGGCPAGKPVSFAWQGTKSTPLGTATLEQSGDKCIATLRTSPPEADRSPGDYTLCGTYTRPDASTVGACEDFVIDAQAEGSPITTPGSTGGTGGTPGSTPTNEATGSPTAGHGTTGASPGQTSGGAEPSPHATGEATAEGEHATEEASTGPIPAYVALALILATAILAMREADSHNKHH